METHPLLILLLIFLGVVLFWAVLLHRELIDWLIDARRVEHIGLNIPARLPRQGCEVPLRQSGLRFSPHLTDFSLNDVLGPRMLLYEDGLRFHAWTSRWISYEDIRRLSVPGGGKFVLTLSRRDLQLVGWLSDPEALPELVRFFHGKGVKLDARATMIFRDFSVA